MKKEEEKEYRSKEEEERGDSKGKDQ